MYKSGVVSITCISKGRGDHIYTSGAKAVTCISGDCDNNVVWDCGDNMRKSNVEAVASITLVSKRFHVWSRENNMYYV